MVEMGLPVVAGDGTSATRERDGTYGDISRPSAAGCAGSSRSPRTAPSLSRILGGLSVLSAGGEELVRLVEGWG